MKRTIRLMSMVLAVITASSLMTLGAFAADTPRVGKKDAASSKAVSGEAVAPAVKSPSRDPVDYPLLNIPELIIVDYETPSTRFMEMYSEKDGTTFYFYADKGKKSMSYLGETKFDLAAHKAYLAKHPNRPFTLNSKEACTDSMQELLDEFNGYRGVAKEKFSNKTCLPTMEVPPSSYKYGPNAVLPTDIATSAGNADKKTTDATTYATEVIELVNKERKAAGKSALKEDNTLTEVANTRAKEIVGKFSHIRPNGETVSGMVNGYEWIGENLAAGQSTPEAAMKGWIASKGHKETMLSNNFTKIGVACYQDSDGNFYWVQVFRD